MSNSDGSATPKTPLNMIAGRDVNGKTLELLKGYSGTVVRQAFEEAKPIVVTGTEQGRALGSESAVLHNLRSIMAVPLRVRDKTLGVVYVDSQLANGLFNNEDLDLFTAISNHIAVAFETSRMAKVEIERASLQKELAVQMAVAAESRKVKILVDNMQQALFSVNSEGKVVEPVSRFSESVFGRQITDQDILEVLFSSADQQQKDFVNSFMMTVFGEDSLQWDLMEGQMPRKVKFLAPASGDAAAATPAHQRTLKVQPAPIWDAEERLERVLFVVEDITSLEAMENQIQQSRSETLILEDIIRNKVADLREFLKNAVDTLDRLAKDAVAISKTEMAPMLRDLHTLKGNARLFKIRQLSDQVHNSETDIGQLMSSQPEDAALRKTLSEEIERIQHVVLGYANMMNKIYPPNSSTADSAINAPAMSQLNAIVSQVAEKMSKEDAAKIKGAVRRLTYRSIKDLIMQFEGMVTDVSHQLGKKVALEVEGDAFVDNERFTSLQESFLHLIRNSIDHGIEPIDARVQAKKPEAGRILVRCEETDAQLTIKIIDDGKGMDEDWILKRAIEKNIVGADEGAKMSREDKLDLIFRAGFSTKEAASEFSGRGIGMDVVKQSIAKLGGKLRLETKPGMGSTFSIVLAKSE